MSVDQALREEVEALLTDSALKINYSGEVRPSVFQSTWKLISNPFEKRHTNTGCYPESPGEDFSDMAISLSGIHSNVFKCYLPDGNESYHSFGMSETALLSSCNSVGPPSIQDSPMHIHEHEPPPTIFEEVCRRPVKLNRRNNSRILSHSKAALAQASRSSCNSSNAKEIERKSSEGLNGVLESNISVGSTHRSSLSELAPRSAHDYIMRVQMSETEKRHDIPLETFKYINPSEAEKGKASIGSGTSDGSKTPVLHDENDNLFCPSPVTQTFLDTVNEQIRRIKFEQKRERIWTESKSFTIGDIQTPVEHVIYGHGKSHTETMSIGTTASQDTLTEQREVDREDFCIQTDPIVEQSSSKNVTASPWGWGMKSAVDSQASIATLNLQRSNVETNTKPSFYPLNLDAISEDSVSRRLLPRTRVLQRTSSIFNNFWSLNNAVGITQYTLQAAWNTAEEIFYGCIIPQEMEDQPPIEDNVAENEERLAVSLMRLMGIPVEYRNAIYREVLGEIQALHDFSCGTVSIIGIVIDWICTGTHDGTDDIIEKTRLLATSQTEVDPDSESWKAFEHDMYIYSKAVMESVRNAARVVTNRGEETVNSAPRVIPTLIRRNLVPEESQMHLDTGDSTRTESEESFGSSPAQITKSSSRETGPDYDSPVNPDLISQIVTPSEFDMPVTPKVIATDSLTSRASTMSSVSQRSRIPVRILSNTSTKTDAGKDITDEDFNLNLLRSTLRYDPNSQKDRNYSKDFDSQRKNGAVEKKKALSRQRSYSEWAGTGTSRVNKPGSKSNVSGKKEPSNTQVPPGISYREKYMTRQDKQLLDECRRLTSMPSSGQSSPGPRMSRTSELVENTGTYTPQESVGLRGNLVYSHPTNMAADGQYGPSPADFFSIASSIASVATTVTSGIISKASSAASYIPSFSDTFGPQVDEECRFPEFTQDSYHNTGSFLDTLQQAATNVFYGHDELVTEPNLRHNRRVRSSNRFVVSPSLLSDDGRLGESKTSFETPPFSGITTLNSQGSDKSNNNNNNSPRQSQPQATTEKTGDPAWELFDYVKKLEAEKTTKGGANNNNSNTHRFSYSSRKPSEHGINEQPPPESLAATSSMESSLTARLSKAALTGLFNTFAEAIPAPLVTMEPRSANAYSPRKYELPANYLEARKSPSPTPFRETLKYKTPSGHDVFLNSPASFSHLGSTGSPSSPIIYVPQNSDSEFTRQIAEHRMKEDFAYLDNIIQDLHNDQHDQPLLPTEKAGRGNRMGLKESQEQPQRSRSLRSRIPLRFSCCCPQDVCNTDNAVIPKKNPGTKKSSLELGKTENSLHTSIFKVGVGVKSCCKIRSDVNAGEKTSSKPRIVHLPAGGSTQPGRLPVKPMGKVNTGLPRPNAHLSNATKQNAPAPPIVISVPATKASSKASTTSAHGNSSSSSYLAMANRQKSSNSNNKIAPAASRTSNSGTKGGSYLSASRYQEQRKKPPPPSQPNLTRTKDGTRNSSVKVLKATGGNYCGHGEESNACSSCVSSTEPMSILSPQSLLSSMTNRTVNNGGTSSPPVSQIGYETVDLKRESPLFFPPLDKPGGSLPPFVPLLINPFSKLRGSKTNSDNPPSHASTTDSSFTPSSD